LLKQAGYWWTPENADELRDGSVRKSPYGIHM
jgi:hypothetical protein